MLHAAGKLTLDFAQALLPEGFGLKDATPYNVLFRGPEPVFVDLLSVEQRDARDPVWLSYAQFVRMFLLPLLAYRKFGMSLQEIFLTHRDGLEPEEVYRWCGPLERVLPPTLTLASLPTWFHSRAESPGSCLYEAKRLDDPARARFVLDSLLGGLARTLGRLEPRKPRRSAWSDYMAGGLHYPAEEFAAKETFVREALAQCRPQKAELYT